LLGIEASVAVRVFRMPIVGFVNYWPRPDTRFCQERTFATLAGIDEVGAGVAHPESVGDEGHGHRAPTRE
jgi:hypothetical protein